MMKDLSTKEAASLSYLSQRTISKMCDNESLESHKVPGSRFRRIRIVDLYEMMLENDIPTDLINRGDKELIVFSKDSEYAASARNADLNGTRLSVCNSLFDLGLFVASNKRDNPIAERVVAIDFEGISDPELSAIELAFEGIRQKWGKIGGKIVGICSEEQTELLAGLNLDQIILKAGDFELAVKDLIA